MCTAIKYNAKGHYFGRNLDLDCSYGEEVCVMPRCFPLPFRKMPLIKEHYAIIGMATVVQGMPLYYDGVNEYGLAMAGLNFPKNAFYGAVRDEKDNVAPFELIPWVLGTCKSVEEARKRLEGMALVDIPFSDVLPLAPLHWMIADQRDAIVVEAMKDGLHVYDNPVGILTNNPPFPYHMNNLNNYRNLRVDNGESAFSQTLSLDAYCQGLGAVGLPGDYSSMSRFVRAAFHLTNSVCEETEKASVGQFFHLLTSVAMVKGCCLTETGKWDETVYSACMNQDKGLYYYTTYGNRQITCVDMHRTDLDKTTLTRFKLLTEQAICMQVE